MHRTHRAHSLAALAAALLVSSGALAHDPVPAGVTPLFGTDGELLGGYANFGFVLLEDADPRWVCEEVLPRAETDVWLAPDGALVVSTRGGVHRSTDGGCTWEAATGLDTLLAVAGLAPDPTAPDVVWAATASTSEANALYRSDDGGVSFAQVAAPDPSALLRDPLVDPQRGGVWLAGYVPETNTERLFFVDAGTGEATAWDELVADVVRARPLDIDPDTGDLLLGAAYSYNRAVLRRCAPDAGCTDVGVLEGDDATGPHAITTAVAVDGTVWATFTGDTLWRTDADGALIEVDGPSRCVARAPDGALFGCARIDQGTAFVARDGEGWRDTFAYADIVPRACPDDTLATQACPVIWSAIREYGVRPAPEADADAGADAGAAPDAGDPSPVPQPSEGCASARGRADIGAWLGLLALATTRRRPA